MAASTVTIGMTVVAGLFACAIVAMMIWAVRLQRRQYPKKPLVTTSDAVKREVRWYGFIFGGGRG
jgi:hypothetical protein